MLQKLRNRLKRSTESSKGKGGKNSSSIFRKSRSSSDTIGQTVEPALTFTLSEDEQESTTSTQALLSAIKSPKIQKIASYVFTEEEMIAHGVNQIKMMAAKEEEIVKLQRVHEELNDRLKETETRLEEAQEELDFSRREIAEVYQELSEKDDLLAETKVALYDAEQQLKCHAQALIECQHKLYETTEKTYSFWPW